MRSASSGLWKPMLFSAAIKSQRIWARRCRSRASARAVEFTPVWAEAVGDRVDGRDQRVFGHRHRIGHLFLDRLDPPHDVLDVVVAGAARLDRVQQRAL